MSLNEPKDENAHRILTDVKGKIISLPNVEEAKNLYGKDVSTSILQLPDFRKILLGLISEYSIKKEGKVKIGEVDYDAVYREKEGAVYLKAPEGSDVPSIYVESDGLTSSVNRVLIVTPRIHIGQSVTIEKLEYFKVGGDKFNKTGQTIVLEFPKKETTFGCENEERYKNIEVVIINDSKQGMRLDLSLIGEGADILKVIELVQEQNKDNNDVTNFFVPNKTTQTKQDIVASNIAINLAQEITGEKMEDITTPTNNPTDLAEKLFGRKVKVVEE